MANLLSLVGHTAVHRVPVGRQPLHLVSFLEGAPLGFWSPHDDATARQACVRLARGCPPTQ